MIEKILHQTTTDGRLSWEEKRYSDRLARIFLNWQPIRWSDEDNRRIVKENFPEYLERYDRLRFGVMKADIARYVYMHALGGLYVDTDYKMLRFPRQFSCSASCILPIEEGEIGTADFKIGNAVLGSSKGHPFWESLIRHIFDYFHPEDVSSRDDVVAATGPVAITKVFMTFWQEDVSIALPERNLFHPDRRFFGISHAGPREAVGYHQCWGSWRGKRMVEAFKNGIRRKLNGAL